MCKFTLAKERITNMFEYVWEISDKFYLLINQQISYIDLFCFIFQNIEKWNSHQNKPWWIVDMT